MNSSPRSPQLSIFLLPDGTARAESIGRNGTRRKIDLDFDFADRNPEIMAELRAQADEQRSRDQQALRELQAANIAKVVSAHGPGVARKVWHNGELVFSRAWKRYLDREAADLMIAKRTNTASNAKRMKSAAPGVTINLDDI